MSTFARPVSHGPSSAANYSGERRLGGAFWVSLALHGSAVVVVLLTTLTLRTKAEPPPQVFELVEGEGNNYAATEAPAGHESGRAAEGELIQPSIQSVASWTPPAAQPEPEPVPVTPIAPVAPAPSAPVAQAEPAPNFKRQITSVKRQEERKADREIRQQRAADQKAATAAAAEAARQQRATSFDQFQRSQGSQTNASQRPVASSGSGAATGPRIDADSIKKGVTGGTGANREGAGGRALTAEAGPAMDRYFTMLRERLRANHEKPGGLSDLLSADVEFTLAANGVLTGVRIKRSSGNADFDASVLEAFARVRSIGSRPDGQTGTHSLTFRMKEV